MPNNSVVQPRYPSQYRQYMTPSKPTTLRTSNTSNLSNPSLSPLSPSSNSNNSTAKSTTLLGSMGSSMNGSPLNVAEKSAEKISTENLKNYVPVVSENDDQIQCMKIKFRADRVDKFKNFANKISRDRKTFRDVLRTANIEVESVFIEHALDGDYLVLYQRTKDLLTSNQIFQQSTHPIDEEFRTIMAETLDPDSITTLELVLDGETYTL